MWCSSCQQDVPGIASPVDGTPCCPRCNREVEGNTLPYGCNGAARNGISQKDRTAPQSASLLPDHWELNQELKHIERMLYLGGHGDHRAKRAYRREAARYDVAHAVVPAWHVPLKAEIRRRKRKRQVRAARGGMMGAVTWIAFAAGAIALLSGGGLLAWSVAADRVDLWNMGLPTTLGGQIGLLLAIGFRLERLWRENRAAMALQNDRAESRGEKHAKRSRKHRSHAATRGV